MVTVLDLKDALFCIPLHPDSQFLSASEDPSDQSTQLTRTVLPQCLQIVPLFGQALAQGLCQFEHPQTPVIQYAGDILLCGPSEEIFQEDTRALLNFLAERAYKVPKSKAQLCQTSVPYLGLVLTKRSRALEKVGPSLFLPALCPIHVLKQLRSLGALLDFVDYGFQIWRACLSSK